MLNVAGDIEDSLANGPGLRYVLFTQGCKHHCDGCHNPHTWSYEPNRLVSIDEVFEDIKSKKLITGVTFSGGEPFDQAAYLFKLAIRIKKELGLNILIYTGYTYEEIRALRILRWEEAQYKNRLLNTIDILIDGKFQKDLQEGAIRYAGSSNQRMLYLKGGEIIEK